MMEWREGGVRMERCGTRGEGGGVRKEGRGMTGVRGGARRRGEEEGSREGDEG